MSLNRDRLFTLEGYGDGGAIDARAARGRVDGPRAQARPGEPCDRANHGPGPVLAPGSGRAGIRTPGGRIISASRGPARQVGRDRAGTRPGNYRHPAPDVRRFLACAAKASRAYPPDIRDARPGGSVWFCDTRRLGKIAWYAGDDAAEAAFARSHGPDALEIASDDLANRLSKTSRGIKPTLMDQKVLAGIGNIYADEVLFRSRLHPDARLRDSRKRRSSGSIERSAKFWPGRSRSRGRALTLTTGRFMGLKETSRSRSRCTAAGACLARPAPSRS